MQLNVCRLVLRALYFLAGLVTRFGLCVLVVAIASIATAISLSRAALGCCDTMKHRPRLRHLPGPTGWVVGTANDQIEAAAVKSAWRHFLRAFAGRW